MTRRDQPGPSAREHHLPRVLQCEAPRASLASRKPPGTTRSATSEARAMIGIIVTAMAIAAASPVFGEPEPTIRTA